MDKKCPRCGTKMVKNGNDLKCPKCQMTINESKAESFGKMNDAYNEKKEVLISGNSAVI